MKTIKVLAHVKTTYQGSMVEEEIEVEVEDNATEEEINETIQDHFEGWMGQNTDSGWMIIES